MPELSELDSKNVLNMMLNMVLARRGLHTLPARSYLFNLARLVDHALREYEGARAGCQEYAAREGMGAYYRAQSHLEAFLLSLWRALQYARALQGLHRPGSLDVPPVPNDYLPRTRDEERLTRVRNAILHTEGDIGAGHAPIALLVTSDGVELGGEQLRYSELATWTEQVYAVAQHLVAYEGPLARGSS